MTTSVAYFYGDVVIFGTFYTVVITTATGP